MRSGQRPAREGRGQGQHRGHRGRARAAGRGARRAQHARRGLQLQATREGWFRLVTCSRQPGFHAACVARSKHCVWRTWGCNLHLSELLFAPHVAVYMAAVKAALEIIMQDLLTTVVWQAQM